LLIGQKKPLEPKHVWSIRVRLEIARSRRDLAIVNLMVSEKRCRPGNQTLGKALFCMTDLIEDVLAPAVIERALSIFESFRERNHCEIVQARKVLTPHVFDLIEAGQMDETRLVVSALTYLKSLEARTASEKS
jgi:hypothetical protein